MKIILLFMLMILPICILGLSIYDMDKEKESLKLLVKLMLSGILSCLLVLIISLFLINIFPIFNLNIESMNIGQMLLYAFICVALVEEGCKLLFLYITAYNHKENNYTFDMIVYSVFVSLGFAFFENVLYLSCGELMIGISRAFTAIPAHASYGVFMGIFLSKAKCYDVKDLNKAKMYKLLSLIVPVLIHGLYDLFVFSNTTLFLGTFIISLFSLTLMFLHKKRKDDIKISLYTIE